MACHSSDAATVSHDVDEECEMAMVDVRTAKGKHLGQLLHQGGPGCLNAQHVNDLVQVVRVCPLRVHAIDGQNISQRGAFGVEIPLHALRCLLVGHLRAICPLDQPGALVQEGAFDAGYPAKGAIVKEMLLEPLQHDVVLDDLVPVLVLVVVLADNADADDHLLGIVVGEDDGDVLLVLVLDALGNIFHTQAFVEHLLPVERESQKPARLALDGVLLRGIRDQEVGLDHVKILGNVRGHDVRVIVDFRDGHDGTETGVLNDASQTLCVVLSRVRSIDVDNHRRGLDVLCDVENFLEARNT